MHQQLFNRGAGASLLMPLTQLRDVELCCTSCGDRFVYSAGEQELHTLRGIAVQPSECPPCRKLLGRI